MAASIMEHLDGISFVVVTGQHNEAHVLDLMGTDSSEELGQIEYESLKAGFNYSLLGAPNADAEEIFDTYDYEDEYV